MKNSGYRYRDRVAASDEGVPIAEFYARRYRHSPEDVWRGRILAGQVLRNGRPAAPDDLLARGDELTYDRPPWEEPNAPRTFEALFEDDDVLVLDKPSGMAVLPGGNFLENTLLYLVRARFGPACSPLHRLGRGTSGAILFVRTEGAGRSLATAMAERRIRKVYLALASGVPAEDAFTIDVPIGPVPYGVPRTVHAVNREGRPAVSLVRVIRRDAAANASLVEVTIPTGRSQQIRIHMAYAGFPLVGDPLYGAGGLPRLAAAGDGFGARPGDVGYLLHSWKIRFPHPSRGGEVEVVCPPPAALDPGA